MKDIATCQNQLIELAQKQGYLTFDDIMCASDAFSLSITEVDALSESIQIKGILVYESPPNITQLSSESDNELADYSRTDYDAIFAEILAIAPQLSMLVGQIRVLPAPQYGEIDQLANQIADGNDFARERLISIYLRSVLKIALSMCKQYDFDLEDAVSSGFIGLITAVDRYDPNGFSVFHSYASMWIRQYIQRECNPTWLDLYLPAHVQEKLFPSLQKYEQYTQGEVVGSKAYEIIIARIALEIELSTQDVSRAIKIALDQKYGKESVELLIEQEISNGIASSENMIISELAMYESVYDKELNKTIESVLELLTPKEKQVIKMRNGIGCPKPMTLEEIGNMMNLTRERIRQIEDKAIRKLQHSGKAKKLQGFI